MTRRFFSCSTSTSSSWPTMAPVSNSKSALLVTSLLTTAVLGGSLPDGYSAPSYYPAPYTGWIADWSESVQKAKALVDTMTLAEKANITAGTGIYMEYINPPPFFPPKKRNAPAFLSSKS